MSAPPRVTCVVTAYNYADYLPQAIESALGQDYPRDALEVLVVDDGSTDATPAVMAAYGNRIVGIRRVNGGLNAATQTGIEAATGDLITFLDADDTWRPERLRVLVDALEANPAAGIAWGDMEIIDAGGEMIIPSFRSHTGIVAHQGRIFGRLLRNNFVSAGSLMVRASLRDLYCPIVAEAPYQDWWIASQVARVADIVAVPDPVNRYRSHGANMNLGVDDAGRMGLVESEIPFRRLLLQTAGGLASVPEQLEGLRMLDLMVGQLGHARQTGPRAVLRLTDADREASEAELQDASAALDAGETVGAFDHLVAAVAHDPVFPEPRELLALLTPHAVAAGGAFAVAA